jgi:hypothetical protein
MGPRNRYRASLDLTPGEPYEPPESRSGTPPLREADIRHGHRLISSAIAAAAATAAGLLIRSMVKAVSAPDEGRR